jgi:hypothetical protein
MTVRQAASCSRSPFSGSNRSAAAGVTCEIGFAVLARALRPGFHRFAFLAATKDRRARPRVRPRATLRTGGTMKPVVSRGCMRWRLLVRALTFVRRGSHQFRDDYRPTRRSGDCHL